MGKWVATDIEKIVENQSLYNCTTNFPEVINDTASEANVDISYCYAGEKGKEVLIQVRKDGDYYIPVAYQQKDQSWSEWAWQLWEEHPYVLIVVGAVVAAVTVVGGLYLGGCIGGSAVVTQSALQAMDPIKAELIAMANAGSSGNLERLKELADQGYIKLLSATGKEIITNDSGKIALATSPTTALKTGVTVQVLSGVLLLDQVLKIRAEEISNHTETETSLFPTVLDNGFTSYHITIAGNSFDF